MAPRIRYVTSNNSKVITWAFYVCIRMYVENIQKVLIFTLLHLEASSFDWK